MPNKLSCQYTSFQPLAPGQLFPLGRYSHLEDPIPLMGEEVVGLLDLVELVAMRDEGRRSTCPEPTTLNSRRMRSSPPGQRVLTMVNHDFRAEPAGDFSACGHAALGAARSAASVNKDRACVRECSHPLAVRESYRPRELRTPCSTSPRTHPSADVSGPFSHYLLSSRHSLLCAQIFFLCAQYSCNRVHAQSGQ